MWQAGPTVTMMLGDMGAEIIKIEAIQRLDGWRGGAGLSESRAYERGPNWNGLNRNKLGLTLDLKDADGRAVFERLVTVADVVVENYTPRVMEDFGLPYATLRAINPAIIMISLSGFGSTGPWRDFPAFAFPTEEMSGFSQLTGYPGGPPMLIGHPVTDALAGMFGTFAVLVALEQCRRTGRGQHLDCSQVEALTGLVGDELFEYTMNHRMPPRLGNRHRWMAPHGVYRCRGEDAWVAIAVGSDDEWRSLCAAIERPDLASDPRFATMPERHRHQEELTAPIEQWTRTRDHHEVMHILQAHGVAAGPVLMPSELLSDPHLADRGFFEVLDRAEVGAHPYPGPAFKLSKTPGRLRRPAPLLGEHNHDVLGGLLGLSDDELSRLARRNVIGTAPLPQLWR
jgi:crotonobetainyl-CoA:carnitine CoA-transferase CaiB-like acyl-CoA transferase